MTRDLKETVSRKEFDGRLRKFNKSLKGTTKRDEVFKRWKALARRAQVLDPSNSNAETVKAAAYRKWENIAKWLKHNQDLTVEQLAMADQYLKGISVRSIAKTFHTNRPRVEKELNVVSEVLDRLMNTFEEK